MQKDIRCPDKVLSHSQRQMNNYCLILYIRRLKTKQKAERIYDFSLEFSQAFILSFFLSNCNLFSALFPFQIFDKIRHCKYKFYNFNKVILCVFDAISFGIRASEAQIDLLFANLLYQITCIEPVSGGA